MLLSTDASFQSSVNLISHSDWSEAGFQCTFISCFPSHCSCSPCSQVFVVRVCLCLKCLLIPIALLLIELVMLLKSDVLYF